MKNKDNLNDDIYIIKEYNITKEKDIYNLRIEIDNETIYFKIKNLNESIDYIYKNKLNVTTFINKLELNLNKYSDYELIMKFFDKIYNKNNIIIDEINDDNINLKIKYTLLYEEAEFEIKLYKEYMNINDKFNIMYNQLKLIKNNDNNLKLNNKNLEIEEMRKEINELKRNINKITDINLNDNIINEIINKKVNTIINQYNNEIKDKDKKIIELNNKLEKQKNEINNKNKEIELINQKLEEMNNKLQDYQNKNLDNNINEQFLNNKIKVEKENIIKNCNKQYEELNEKIKNKADINELYNLLKTNEKNKRPNFQIMNEIENLKYITNNSKYEYAELLEIFISNKDDKEYIIFSNIINNNLDIFSLIDNKKIISLEGHKSRIFAIRYFINIKNKNEYLISTDKSGTLIVWDITNNYNIYIHTNYRSTIIKSQSPQQQKDPSKMEPYERADYYGEQLYQKINEIPDFKNFNNYFGKIVGIFLDLEDQVIEKLLKDDKYFRLTVQETIELLIEYKNKNQFK